MKIYQLHKCGGEWEDAYDHIIGSYLRKERAEEERIKAEAKEKEDEEHSKKCGDCYFCDALIEEDYIDINDFISKHRDYCSKIELGELEDGVFDCNNYYQKWDYSFFKIEEVEVEE